MIEDNSNYNISSENCMTDSINPMTSEISNSNMMLTSVSTSSNSISESPKIDDESQIDQDKVDYNLIELKVALTKCSEVLSSVEFKLPDDFDLIVFQLKVKAVYNYTWKVYRKPSEIKDNLKSIKEELKLNDKELDKSTDEIIDKIQSTFSFFMSNKISEIENAYTLLFKNKNVKETLAFKEFFNIGLGSFNQYNNGSKPLEGYAYKREEPLCIKSILNFAGKWFDCLAYKYNKCWVVVKDDCIFYSNVSNSETGRDAYLFNDNIKITTQGKYLIDIAVEKRHLIIKFKTYFERELWLKEIQQRVNKMKNLISRNIYGSYTNEKPNNLAHWFSDGESYFKDLKEQLLQAKETVFITDWWLSPEVWLERPVKSREYMSMAFHKQHKKESPPYSRLMDVLYQIASNGVKVYVLIYQECKLALTLNSKHSQEALEKCHPNIIVTRDPEGISDLLWSHHEKLVIIDQQTAFVGGLDLCWGRWDTNDHPLTEIENSEEIYNFPGIEYSNARKLDFTNVEDYLKESIERKEPRMPWHDVHIRLIGPVVADIARHFAQRWNYARGGESSITDIKQNASTGGDKRKGRQGIKTSEEKKPPSWYNPKEDELVVNIIPPSDGNEKKEEKKEKEKEKEDEKKEDKKEGEEEGEIVIKKKGKTKLINRKKKNKEEEEGNDEDNQVSVDFSKLRSQYKDNSEKEIKDDDHLYRNRPNSKYTTKLRGGKPIGILKNSPNDKNYIEFADENEEAPGEKTNKKKKKDKQELVTNNVNVNFFRVGTKSTVQVLRSVSEWSAGVSKTENSILKGYYQLIDNAEHYLYIENQFFVSKSYENTEEDQNITKESISEIVENRIAYHIRKRIETAYIKKEKFKVYIFIPLLPGFAGEPEEPTIQIILGHTYAGICRNHGLSIIEQLENIMGDKWKDYIGFYSLRGHGVIKGTPVTELIYIHSKLMIVDDKYVLIGSANINDRSMLGTRDSEFAVIVKEIPKLNSIMNGEKYNAAKFAAGFRKALMAEHLGINQDDEILNDPVSDELMSFVQERANGNTVAFRKIFGCYPDDEYKYFKDVNAGKKSIEDVKKNYESEKDNIKGHIVEFPLHFLEKESLGASFFSIYNIIPEKNFI